MSQKTNQKELPKGLIVIRYLYAAIALVYAFIVILPGIKEPQSIFIAIWDKPIVGGWAVAIHAVLVLFPLLLYLGFSRPTVTIWYLAFTYHIFLIGNSILSSFAILFPQSVISPMIRISGSTIYAPATIIEGAMPASLKLFIVFNIILLLGIFILFYLWQQKEYFMPKKFLGKTK